MVRYDSYLTDLWGDNKSRKISIPALYIPQLLSSSDKATYICFFYTLTEKTDELTEDSPPPHTLVQLRIRVQFCPPNRHRGQPILKKNWVSGISLDADVKLAPIKFYKGGGIDNEP